MKNSHEASRSLKQCELKYYHNTSTLQSNLKAPIDQKFMPSEILLLYKMDTHFYS